MTAPEAGVTLTIAEIGRAGDPDAVERVEYPNALEAYYTGVLARFGAEHVRGGTTGGTIGSKNGRVFQASRTWSIQ